MPLPQFDSRGDLPPGVHHATLAEVIERFGSGTRQRQVVTARLVRIHDLARASGNLERLVIFGSYVTAKAAPNDIDIVLVMRDGFHWHECDRETKMLFEHNEADAEFGASIFWIRPALLLSGTLEEFIEYWQIKRDHTQRGIVEVRE